MLVWLGASWASGPECQNVRKEELGLVDDLKVHTTDVVH